MAKLPVLLSSSDASSFSVRFVTTARADGEEGRVTRHERQPLPKPARNAPQTEGSAAPPEPRVGNHALARAAKRLDRAIGLGARSHREALSAADARARIAPLVDQLDPARVEQVLTRFDFQNRTFADARALADAVRAEVDAEDADAIRSEQDKKNAREWLKLMWTHLQLLLEPQGMYREIWDRYRASPDDRDDPEVRAIRSVQRFGTEFYASSLWEEHFVQGEPLTDRQMRNMPRIIAAWTGIEKLVHDAEVSSAARTQHAPSKNALRVLDSLEAQYDAEVWRRAQNAWDNTKEGERRIAGSPKAIRSIGKLIDKYVKLWTDLGTDGIKGASMEILRAMEEVRMALVTVVLEARDVELAVACRPGTPFYGKIYALASQRCSSKDVQTLAGWWSDNSQEKN